MNSRKSDRKSQPALENVGSGPTRAARGRKDKVSSSVYPVIRPDAPKDAEVRPAGCFGRDETGAGRYEDRGGSDSPIGYFGASRGAAAALVAATRVTGMVSAIVSRGGRSDLAGMALHKVIAPTLLIVRENDPEVLALNREAYYAIPSEKKLEIVPKATHLFQERGALDRVVQLARDWFDTHLASPCQKAEPLAWVSRFPVSHSDGTGRFASAQLDSGISRT